jgi:hypothetical protein
VIPQADTAGAGARPLPGTFYLLEWRAGREHYTVFGVGVGPISCIADAELETLEHAGEVVRVPAVTEYQGDGDRLCVVTGPKVARRSPEQLLEMVVHVQLVEHGLD